jgi:hypothetical protein
MKQPLHQSSVFKRALNVLAWILIALLLAATLWAVQWAAKQPRVHSIWGEPSDSPITRNCGQIHDVDSTYGVDPIRFQGKNDSNWN